MMRRQGSIRWLVGLSLPVVLSWAGCSKPPPPPVPAEDVEKLDLKIEEGEHAPPPVTSSDKTDAGDSEQKSEPPVGSDKTSSDQTTQPPASESPKAP
ncbi:MAG: hypothetical protein KatS3mg110_0907 [Pirellulaceae bacterium]|nr:MAG: hypothetical protein KatS3mg110_0907 [Pirellulaceae bacterium]